MTNLKSNSTGIPLKDRPRLWRKWLRLLCPLEASWRIEDYKRQFQKGNKMTGYHFKPFSILYTASFPGPSSYNNLFGRLFFKCRSRFVELLLPVLKTRASLCFDVRGGMGRRGFFNCCHTTLPCFTYQRIRCFLNITLCPFPLGGISSGFWCFWVACFIASAIICKAVLWSLQKHCSSSGILRF